MKAFKAVAIALLFALFLPALCLPEVEVKVSSKDKDIQADYDSVWSAAIDTLYEMKFPIMFMSKSDGYMVTGMKEIKVDFAFGDFFAKGEREMVTIRFVKKEDSVITRISSEMERMRWSKFNSTPNYPPFYVWESAGSDAGLEKLLAKEIASKIKLP